MNPSSTTQNPIVARVKLGLIPLLVLILGVVLYQNSRSSGDSAPVTSAATSPPAPSAPSPSAAVSSGAEIASPLQASKTSSPRTWPHYPLAAIIAADPFTPVQVTTLDPSAEIATTPPLEVQAEPTPSPETASRWEHLLHEKISAVYVRGTRTVALMGSRVVQIGDELEGGLRVVAVDADGILVEASPIVEEAEPPTHSSQPLEP